ncbi:hypothetical protein BIU82_18325 [Arthrobacter sp. SW1]|nr:hypothetical protein BIU82_18325 [Arthrobacter sp. SW1]
MDSRLLGALREQPGRGHVHSVFDRVINITAPWGGLVSVAVKQLDDAPWTVRAEAGDWSGLIVQPGDPVLMDSRRFAFGPDGGAGAPEATVQLGGAREWFAKKVDMSAFAAADFTLRADAIESVLEDRGVRGGILEAAEGGSEGAGALNDFEKGIAEGLRSGREALRSAVSAGDATRIRDAALALLGLGSGLTPAGDDYLCGLALIASQPGSRLAGLRAELSDVVAQNPERTTELSWTTLREALDGRAREALLELLSQLVRRKPEDAADLAQALRVPFDRVLAIGHSSGTDILCGLLAGLRLEAALR